MVAVAVALLVAALQDPATPAPGPSDAPPTGARPIPADETQYLDSQVPYQFPLGTGTKLLRLGTQAPPAAAPAKELAPIIPATEERAGSPRILERPEAGPGLGGFLFWSGVVMALLVGAFLLLRRWGRGSRFLAGGGVINVLARKPLGQRQEVFLVEVGTKVFLIGSTKEHLSTLGEFAHPDEVAVLRANLPGKKADSVRATFRESLREGLKEEERPAPARGYDSILGELAEIRKTVRAWRA